MATNPIVAEVFELSRLPPADADVQFLFRCLSSLALARAATLGRTQSAVEHDAGTPRLPERAFPMRNKANERRDDNHRSLGIRGRICY